MTKQIEKVSVTLTIYRDMGNNLVRRLSSVHFMAREPYLAHDEEIQERSEDSGLIAGPEYIGTMTLDELSQTIVELARNRCKADN